MSDVAERRKKVFVYIKERHQLWGRGIRIETLHKLITPAVKQLYPHLVVSGYNNWLANEADNRLIPRYWHHVTVPVVVSRKWMILPNYKFRILYGIRTEGETFHYIIDVYDPELLPIIERLVLDCSASMKEELGMTIEVKQCFI